VGDDSKCIYRLIPGRRRKATIFQGKMTKQLIR
jgi:hypothetical protein